jgi:hypothetical protein
MTEDREMTSGEDREQTADDVEGHSLAGQNAAGQTVARNADRAADEDEPDVEGHSLAGQNVAGQNTA